MIEVKHLTKNYGNFRAVNDMSFSIPTGEIVGLLGPNGAGKTTTMRMIAGFSKPTSGEVLLDGKNIAENPVGAKKKIGYMSEAAPLYGDMIVEDYLRYVSEMHEKNPEEKIASLCDECGLHEVMHKNIADLSRGYRQRVGLAHALTGDAELLILDEPTSGLDPNQIGEVRSLIKEIGKTRTVIISTHILSEVEMLCDRVIIISHGSLVADSPTTTLRERYGQKLSINLTASVPDKSAFISALQNISGVASVREDGNANIARDENARNYFISLSSTNEIRNEIFKTVCNANGLLYELSLQKNSLEEVFHELTSESEVSK